MAPSLGQRIGAAARQTGVAPRTVIATVNGQPIFRETLEMARTAAQRNGDVSEKQAYHLALETLIDQEVRQQVAIQRGITVTDQEAKAALAEMRRQAGEVPDFRTFYADQQRALGLNDTDYNTL